MHRPEVKPGSKKTPDMVAIRTWMASRIFIYFSVKKNPRMTYQILEFREATHMLPACDHDNVSHQHHG